MLWFLSREISLLFLNFAWVESWRMTEQLFSQHMSEIHPCCCKGQWSLPFYCWPLFHCVCTTMYPSPCHPSGLFSGLGIMNKGAINICVVLWRKILISLGNVLRLEIGGSQIGGYLTIRNCQNFFQRGIPCYTPISSQGEHHSFICSPIF